LLVSLLLIIVNSF